MVEVVWTFRCDSVASGSPARLGRFDPMHALWPGLRINLRNNDDGREMIMKRTSGRIHLVNPNERVHEPIVAVAVENGSLPAGTRIPQR